MRSGSTITRQRRKLPLPPTRHSLPDPTFAAAFAEWRSIDQQTMADNKQDKDLDISEVYTKSELFIEKNKKPLTIAAVALFVGVAAFVGWRQFVVGPAIKDAEENVWKAQYYFEIDSLDLAINGDGQWLGFEAIADEYGNTPTGDLAHSYLGAIYMKQEQWQMAIDHYEEADLGDDVLRVMAVGNIGDCYVEMNEMDKAVGQFEKAADMVKSDFTTPMYLMKAGILHKQAGNWKAAAKAFRRVANDFPQHSDVNQAKKYAAMAEAMAG